VSILWLVLCANAFNLIDGMDGLATGVAIIASASLLLAALIHHHVGLAVVITPLVGALFGFLYYNFNPASVFLGDCGSLLIGFLLGCYGLMWNQHSAMGLGQMAPLVALALPVFEVVLSVIRRFLRSQPVFGSDRHHIHHRMQALGLSQKKAAFVLYAVSILAATVAVLQTILRPRLASVLLLLFLGVIVLGLKFLGYKEFGILGRFLFHGEFRQALRARIDLSEYEESLGAAKTLDECWTVLQGACRHGDFNYVSVRTGVQLFEAMLRPTSGAAGFQHTIAWSGPDSATFGYDGRTPNPDILVSLAERFHAKLRATATLSIRTAEAGSPARLTQEISPELV
jgi:UDP-GlcNAc:undecaprenyl-phosphate GlcNAc-1-phosphate transferase